MNTLHFSQTQFLILLVFGFLNATMSLADDLLKPGDRIVFIGDSNTYAGTYVADFDAIARTSGKSFDVVNVGLPSETCCGLSEPDHPFPRPTVQERIDRVLKKMQPDVVVACYGMNDGIYHPFSAERFEKYKAGIMELIGRVKKSGAKLVLLTPPPFDPLPMKKKGKLVDKDSKQFAWFLIYKDYDSVLEKYSQWIKTLAPKVDVMIDIRTPIVKFMSDQRKTDPEFTMSGDGVHFNATCHRIIARAVAQKLIPNSNLKINDKLTSLTNKKMTVLRNAWLTETGHKRPGIKNGLPLKDALAQAEEIDKQLKSISSK